MISAKTKARWDYYSVIEGAREEGEELGRAIGEALGEARGEARGAHEKAVEMAIKLIKKGLGLAEISELTELSITEIEKLHH